MTIRFTFDAEKSAAALAYLSMRGVAGLDKMKAAKLLYFADKIHLQRYARPITGDSYACMEHGPIPSNSFNQIRAIIDMPESPFENKEQWLALFEVNRKPRYPQLEAKQEPDLDVFSDSDIEVLNEVAERYGDKSAWTLRDLAHCEPDVIAADRTLARSDRRSVPISFESLLGEDSPMLELILEDQENRAFAESLNW